MWKQLLDRFGLVAAIAAAVIATSKLAMDEYHRRFGTIVLVIEDADGHRLARLCVDCGTHRFVSDERGRVELPGQVRGEPFEIFDPTALAQSLHEGTVPTVGSRTTVVLRDRVRSLGGGLDPARRDRVQPHGAALPG